MKIFNVRIWILIVFLSLVACNNNTDEINNVKDATIETVFPFSKAHTIEIYSYEGSFESVSSFSDYFSKNFGKLKQVNILNDTNLHVKDRISLNAAQKNQLFEILYKENCGDDLVGNCFNPNHAIVYYDESGRAFAYTEISLDCMNAVSSKDVGTYKFCDAKIQKITSFFKSIGVNYFGDDIVVNF